MQHLFLDTKHNKLVPKKEPRGTFSYSFQNTQRAHSVVLSAVTSCDFSGHISTTQHWVPPSIFHPRRVLYKGTTCRHSAICGLSRAPSWGWRKSKRDFPSSKINCVGCRKWMRWAILGSLQIPFGLWSDSSSGELLLRGAQERKARRTLATC